MKHLLISILMIMAVAGLQAQVTVTPLQVKAGEEVHIRFTPDTAKMPIKGDAQQIKIHLKPVQGKGRGWKTQRMNKEGSSYAATFILNDLFPKFKRGKIIVQFSDKLEKNWVKKDNQNPFYFYAGDYSTDNYKAYKQKAGKLIVKGEKHNYTLDFFKPAIARLSVSGKDLPNADSSHAIVRQPLKRALEISEEKDSLIAMVAGAKNGKALQVVVKKHPIAFQFYRNGKRITAESGGFFNRNDYKGFRMQMGKKEQIYGTGSRSIPMDRRGHKIELYNQPHYGYAEDAPNLNYSVPVYASSRNYMLLFDNAQKGYMDIGSAKDEVLEMGAIGGNFDYVVIAGATPKRDIELYTWLTGRQPMAPRWALGNLQSRFGYETQQQAENVVDSMLAAGYPLDALIIDLFWFGDGKEGQYYMGNLSWDKERWPQPEKMMRDFKEKGVKTILITEPYILTNSTNFNDAKSNGLLAKDTAGNTNVITRFYFGDAGLIDIFNPEAREWFWQQYKRQVEKGVDGWWGDLGEPETHPDDLVHAAGTAKEVHNIYGHYWHKMLFERYTEAYPNTRLFNLNRSGFAGSQRYSIYPWSGDVARSWSGLRAQMPILLGMSVSGLGYMHSDLGGFAMGEKDNELYTRWLQFGTFNPVYRPHGSDIPSEPIYFSSKTQRIVKRYIKLRYRLMPYNYTLAWENANTGLPLARPLYMQFPEEKRLQGIADTYCWGDAFLVAPVIRKNAKMRNIPLPQGKWYDYWRDTLYTGGANLRYKLSYKNMPVFVKAGSFIPEVPALGSTNNYGTDTLRVTCYPLQEKGTFSYRMYNDNGKARGAYEAGNYEFITFHADEKESRLKVRIERKGGFYEGRPDKRHVFLQIPAGITYKKATAGGKTYNLEAKNGMKVIKLEQQDEPIEVEFR